VRLIRCRSPDSLHRIRTTREHGATIPILIISSEPSIADAILIAGANRFLPTSFPVAAFVQILRTLLPIAAQGSATALRFAMRMYQEISHEYCTQSATCPT
jgi:DNA-binding NarL/FixJ family response regulator